MFDISGTAATVDPAVTTGPVAGSTKIYKSLDGAPGARVPFRRVYLPLAQ